MLFDSNMKSCHGWWVWILSWHVDNRLVSCINQHFCNINKTLTCCNMEGTIAIWVCKERLSLLFWISMCQQLSYVPLITKHSILDELIVYLVFINPKVLPQICISLQHNKSLLIPISIPRKTHLATCIIMPQIKLFASLVVIAFHQTNGWFSKIYLWPFIFNFFEKWLFCINDRLLIFYCLLTGS